MTKIRNARWPSRLAAHAAAGALALLAAGAPPAWAQAATDCGSIVDRSERLACKSSRLKEKFDRAAGEAQQAADTLKGDAFRAFTTEEQRSSLEASSARLGREKERVTAAALRGQAGSRKFKCPLKECDPDVDSRCVGPVDGDGICDPGESCWEVIGDRLGDDQQPCDLTATGKDREACAEVCDARATEADDNVDEGALDEVETLYDDAGNVAQEINEALPAMAAAAARVQAAQAADDPCAETAALGRWSWEWRFFAQLGTTTLRGAADTAERFCDSTTMGNSAALACYGFEIAASVSASLQTILEISEGNIDAAVMDASLACARQARDKSKDLADRISAAKQKLQAIEERQAHIIELIETAQGRRADFPLR
jgi:hypothetical protein